MSSVHGFEIGCNGTRKRPTAKVVVVRPPTPAPLPEAPCSVNGFFYVEGYPDRFQATGRGLTDVEAASNLAGTIAATRAALGPRPVVAVTPVVSRTERLFALLASGVARAEAKGELGMIERLRKAADLVRAGAVTPGNRAGVMAVRSESAPDTWYEVEAGRCPCKDFVQGHNRCKHVLAVLFVYRLNEEA